MKNYLAACLHSAAKFFIKLPFMRLLAALAYVPSYFFKCY